MHRPLAFAVLSLFAAAALAQQPFPQQQQQQPQQPMAIFQGDGLTVTILNVDMNTGQMSGMFTLGGQNFPWRGQVDLTTDIEKINGTFTAGGQQYPFSTVEVPNTEQVNLTTGGKTYRLMPVAPQQPAPQPQPQPQPDPNNPLGGDNPPAPQPPIPPNPLNPAPAPQPVQPNPQPPTPQPQQSAAMPESMKLTLHKFQDVNMGMTSHVVLLPENWKSQGQVQWSQGDSSFPQRYVEITSPAGGRVRLLPMMNFGYTESKPLQGMPQMPPQGIPVPADFPQWLVGFIQQTNQSIQNVALVDAQRDQQSEQMQADIEKRMGSTNGIQRQSWNITLEYDEANVRRRELINVTCFRFPDIDNQNIRSQMWGLATDFVISAPAQAFPAMKGELVRVAGSVSQTPEWSMASQKLIGELQQVRIDARWEAINRRGREIAQMPVSSQQKESYYLSDKAQRDRLNLINETSDYRDTDGSRVNLPMHYHHVWSDGKGNYVLSNNSQHKPGETWNELPAQR